MVREREFVIEIRRLMSVRVGEAYTVVVESDLHRQVSMHKATGCITVLPNRPRVTAAKSNSDAGSEKAACWQVFLIA